MQRGNRVGPADPPCLCADGRRRRSCRRLFPRLCGEDRRSRRGSCCPDPGDGARHPSFSPRGDARGRGGVVPVGVHGSLRVLDGAGGRGEGHGRGGDRSEPGEATPTPQPRTVIGLLTPTPTRSTSSSSTTATPPRSSCSTRPWASASKGRGPRCSIRGAGVRIVRGSSSVGSEASGSSTPR